MPEPKAASSSLAALSMRGLTLDAAVNLACTLEVIAPKAGNVYPGAEFADLSVADFLASAAVCSAVLHHAAELSVGELILQCVSQSKAVTRSNANLGIVLLLAPLAKAAASIGDNRSADALRTELSRQLKLLAPRDGRLVYQAIRMSAAGGLGNAEDQDVHETQSDVDLIAAMRQAQQRDKVAEQYSTDFRFVFEVVVPCLSRSVDREADYLRGITRSQIELLAEHADTLIGRKCGDLVSQEAMQRAVAVRDAGGFDKGSAEWMQYDAWLRADANRRNPGTTADLIAAGLFVLIYCGPEAR